jgi:hypothetical protein
MQSSTIGAHQLRRGGGPGDLSRSVALNHVKRYATLMVIISKRATSHRARLGDRTRFGRQALGATLKVKGTGDAAAPGAGVPLWTNGPICARLVACGRGANRRAAVLEDQASRRQPDSAPRRTWRWAGLWANVPPGGLSTGGYAGQVSRKGLACPHSGGRSVA